MVFISRKKIKGKPRYYLEKSIRFPDGRVKKFSFYLKDYNPKGKSSNIAEHTKILDSRISNEIVEFAASNYEKSNIFDEDMIRRLEEIKLGYKKIIKKITKKQMQDIVDRFTVNFTYESNAIEGNSLTLKDVAIVLHEKRVLKGKELREIYETLNTREAMGLIFSNKLRITIGDIIKLHKILTKNTGVASGFKLFPNFILGRNVQTTLPEDVESEMKELIGWYYKSPKVHPLQKASIFHGRFEKIHPFEDGNGRVGRLLINIMLINKGYPPLIIRKTQRIAYFGCLEAFDKSHKDKLYRFLAEKYKDTYEKFFKVYIKYV